jgi:hypothetical protein|tara:strand:- start:150 stop:338 length:189 start_codon:yes stop_codon:yes gene_type:complete
VPPPGLEPGTMGLSVLKYNIKLMFLLNFTDALVAYFAPQRITFDNLSPQNSRRASLFKKVKK